MENRTDTEYRMNAENCTDIEASMAFIADKRALKRSHRRGLIKGIVGTLIVCIVAAAVFGGVVMRRMNQTTVAIAVTEGGKTKTELKTYESLLNPATVQKINQLAASIQSYYYEDISAKELEEGLYQGLFSNLDIYSTYYTAEEYDELYNMEINGNYCGIGATLTQNMDTMVVEVIKVQKGSPAEAAGMEAGDLLIKADEYEATTMELSEFVTHLRGEAGTSVTVEVYRESDEQYHTFEMVRAPLEVEAVEYELLDNNIGYIQITEFIGTTPDHFKAAIADLQSQGMTSMIIDLRDNPGGLLTAVGDCLDVILPECLLTYTEDRYGNRAELMADDPDAIDLPMVVLINGNSASASEIFAAAVSDYEVATLLGTTSYGKGIVQSMQELSDGSAVKMTTSKYFTPNGVCIHEVGITPDVELEYEFLGGEEDEYAYQYDNQLQEAIRLLTVQ